MPMDFKPILIYGLAAPTISVREFKKACHSLMTEQCPSIPRLEKIARGQGARDQLLHTNCCGYCQSSLAIFREILGFKQVWPEPLFAAARAALRKLREAAARELELTATGAQTVFAGGETEQGTRAEFRSAKAVILRPDLSSQSVRVELRKLDFVQHRDLWMILRLEEPVKDLKSICRFELMLMSERDVFGPFTLPDLGAGYEEEIMLQLPQSLAEGWEEQMKRSSSPRLPFEFIFSVREWS